jgi:lipid-binding SYLF domain-containing protein
VFSAFCRIFIGLQIGGQAKDVIIAFMSSDGLKKFRESKGWEAGFDGNVALITVGAGDSAITAMSKEPIVAFVFDVKGLMETCLCEVQSSTN